MALSFERPWILLLLPILAVLLLLVAWLRKTRNILGPAIRYGLMTLLILAAAGPGRIQPEVEVLPRQVIVVDGSASVDPGALAAVKTALANSGLTSEEAVVVQFGNEAQRDRQLGRSLAGGRRRRGEHQPGNRAGFCWPDDRPE